MSPMFVLFAVAAAFAASATACAASLAVQVVDTAGRPVANAVVSLTASAASGGSGRAPAPVAPAQQIIDQRDETFLPLVTLIRIGDQVVFRNSDITRHHVYSFSPIKQFQYVINVGDQSPPIGFDKAGVAAIGCNIHDHMVAYVYVADTPWHTLTGTDGRGTIADLPTGTYTASLWHPRLRPGSKAPTQSVEITAAPTELPFTVALLSEWNRRHDHGHAY